MRVALMVTCVNDAMFPDVGKATVTPAATARRRGRLPRGPDLLRPADGQHRATSTRRCRRCASSSTRSRRTTPWSSRRARAPGRCATSTRWWPRGRATPGWPRRVAETGPRVFELTEFLVDVLGVEDVGASFPHRVTYHPTCHSLRMLGVGDRPARLLRAVRGIDLRRAAAAPSECCGFGGTFAVKNADTSVAMGSDKARHVRETGAEVLVAGDSSCLMHVGGLLSRQRAGVRVDAPRRGARRPRRGAHVTRHLRRDAGLPRAPHGRRSPTRQLRRNLAHATAHHPGQARGRRRRGRGLGGAPARRWRRSRTRHCSHLDEHLLRLEESLQARGATVHWARDAAEACAIVARVATSHGVDEVVKVKSMATQEIELNEALAAEGIAAWETDLAELIVQLGDDLPSHILVPAIHRNRAEIREIFRAARWPRGAPGARRPDRRAGRARGRGPGAPAREVPARQGRRSRAPTSRSPTPGRSSWSSPRATAGCA